MRHVILLALTTGTIACESTSAPDEVVYQHDVTPEMVTGEALAALRPDGRFNFESPATAPGQLSLDTAKSQTLQFGKYVTNRLLLRGVVEAERGGYWTDPHLLTICDEVYFVHSQLGEIRADSLPPDVVQSFRQRFGPQWLIPMCGPQNEPQMVVQVAIDGNDVRFTDTQPVESVPPNSVVSNMWYARGVPLNWPDALNVSAERAVRFVYETFSVRVAKVPELQFRGEVLADGRYAWYQVGSARFCNRWRVILESDVTIRGATTGSSTTTNVVYVASKTCSSHDVAPSIHLPFAQQPGAAILDYVDFSVSPPRTWAVSIPLVAPVRFELGDRTSVTVRH